MECILMIRMRMMDADRQQCKVQSANWSVMMAMMDGWMDGDDDDKGAAANKLIRGRCLTSVTRIDLMKQRG